MIFSFFSHLDLPLPSPSLRPRFSIVEHHLESESLSRFAVSPVLEQDGGELSCEAANRFGRDQKHFFLSVEDVPSPPSGVRLAHLGSRAAEITWHAPHDGNSPILSYVIEYANLPGELIEKGSLMGSVLYYVGSAYPQGISSPTDPP